MEANSQPTYPPPRISRRSGSRSSRRIVSEVHTAASATPGRSGTAGVVPVLITTSRPRTRRTPPSRVRISTVRGPTKRAVPSSTILFFGIFGLKVQSKSFSSLIPESSRTITPSGLDCMNADTAINGRPLLAATTSELAAATPRSALPAAIVWLTGFEPLISVHLTSRPSAS